MILYPLVLDLLVSLAYWERLISHFILFVVVSSSHKKFLYITPVIYGNDENCLSNTVAVLNNQIDPYQ